MKKYVVFIENVVVRLQADKYMVVIEGGRSLYRFTINGHTVAEFLNPHAVAESDYILIHTNLQQT